MERERGTEREISSIEIMDEFLINSSANQALVSSQMRGSIDGRLDD